MVEDGEESVLTSSHVCVGSEGVCLLVLLVLMELLMVVVDVKL